jgi:hypothetical protein
MLKDAGMTLLKATSTSSDFKKIDTEPVKDANGNPVLDANGNPTYRKADC